jgi:hypothetical protein
MTFLLLAMCKTMAMSTGAVMPYTMAVNITLKYAGETCGNSRCDTAHMPAMSAPILRMMAGALKNIITYNTGVE